MGCDIHAHMEIKWGGKWLYYGPLKIGRNYNLFSLLADVRNVSEGEEGYVRPITQPRGLPEDATDMTMLHYNSYMGDEHSPSWVTSKEYLKAVKQFPFNKEDWKSTLYLFGNNFESFKPTYNRGADLFGSTIDGFPKQLEDFRMIFWFDN